MSKTKSIVHLSAIFTDSIASRAAVINLFRDVTEKIQSIALDFEDITFISRSASHQFMLEKERFEKKKIKVEFLSVSRQVKEMFEAIHEASKKEKESPKIHRVRFTSPSFQNFLQRV